MAKKAIILDLDNTIYSVHSIGNKLFAPLFDLIAKSGNHTENIGKIKSDIMRKPFQIVAAEHGFDNGLKEACLSLLQKLTCDFDMEPFEDYKLIGNLQIDKFLVTTGFLNLQQSKVDKLGIRNDFKEIRIVDPSSSSLTKKAVFRDILERYRYEAKEILVVGDDPQSEIAAAIGLGIDVVLYDKNNLYQNQVLYPKITDYGHLSQFLR